MKDKNADFNLENALDRKVFERISMKLSSTRYFLLQPSTIFYLQNLSKKVLENLIGEAVKIMEISNSSRFRTEHLLRANNHKKIFGFGNLRSLYDISNTNNIISDIDGKDCMNMFDNDFISSLRTALLKVEESVEEVDEEAPESDEEEQSEDTEKEKQKKMKKEKE